MRCVLVDGDNCLLEPAQNQRGYLPVPGCFAGLELLRKHARVVVVIDAASRARHLFTQRNLLTQQLGFSVADIRALPLKSAADGDVFLSPSGLVLSSWKVRRPLAPALLWHAPPNLSVPDEPIWTRVCDWNVVAWFARGGRSLAVGS